MLSNSNKKPNNLVLSLFVLVIPITVSALSVSEFFGFLGSSTVSNSTKNINQNNENLQNLKVFEPNQVFAQSALDANPVQASEQDSQNSFEVNDNLSGVSDVMSSDNRGNNAVYIVQKGDSIYSIADYFGVSVSTIMTYNHKDIITVHVGDVLQIPPISGILYTVQKNDNLSDIAKKYNVNEEDVSLYNGIFSSDDLAVGDEIFLPGAKKNGSETDSPSSTQNSNNKSTTKNTKNSKTNSGSKNSLAKGDNALANPITHWEKGDTEHLNTVGDIKKYSSLPKYPGYYIMPSPGATRTQKMHGHNGTDLANKLGSPVLAAADGVVKVAKSGGYNFGYGNYIVITHPNGTETLYGHLLKVEVTVGQSVSQGQEIALLGSTGNSTGPHVHFEVHGAYNPFAW